jgi:hypothetical protein
MMLCAGGRIDAGDRDVGGGREMRPIADVASRQRVTNV